MFNALDYTKKLEEVGVPREQAEAHVQMVIQILEGDMATKADIQIAKTDLKSDIIAVRNELQVEMQLLRTELKSDIAAVRNDMQTLEYRLTIKLGAFLAISVASIAAILKLLLPS